MTTDRRVQVVVDERLCVGTRMCTVVAPSMFEFDEAMGVSRAVLDVVALDASLMDAGVNCPVGAVRLTDPVTGEELSTT